MPDEREFKIRITTTADTAGAQAASGALDKTTGATQEATKATEKHTGGLQAMHKVFHSLNEVVPGLGVLMQAAFSPVGAAISMAVLALRTFQEHTRAVNEEFKRLEEEAAKPFTHRLEAMREGTVSLAAAQAELNQRLEHTSHSERSLREEIDRTLEAQKREVALTREVSDAQEKKELSGLAALHEAGLLSEERYFALKLAAEEQYLKKKRSLEEAEEMRGIQAQRRALEKAELEQEGWEGHPGLRQKAQGAVAEKAKAIEDLASFDKPGIDERHKETQKQLKGFEGDHNQEVGWFEQAGGAHATRESLNELMRQQGRATYGTAQFGNFDKWQNLKWAADASEKEWKKAPGEEAGKKVAADNATAAAERASKKAEAAQDLIDEYRRTLPEKRAAFDERHAANAEADQAQNVAARNAMKSTPGGAAVAGGSEGLQRLMEGGKWDLGKEGDIAEINNLLSLVRLLSEMPARERNQPEPRDRTGQNFGRAEGAAFRDSERDLAIQGGKQLDSTSKQANSELVRLLSGLHGLQSETLRTVATHANNTELLARDLAVIKRKVESQSRATSLGFNQQPGN